MKKNSYIAPWVTIMEPVTEDILTLSVSGNVDGNDDKADLDQIFGV